MTENRRKILFVAEAVTLAHVARPWTLAGSLDLERYEPILAVDPRFDALFNNPLFERFPISSISSERFARALKKADPVYDAATLRDYVEADQELFSRFKPDMVVGDFRLSLSISARLSGIPYASISNIYWSPFVQQAYPVPELPLTHVLGVRLGQFLFDRVRPAVFAMHTRPLNRVRKEYGLPSLGLKLQRVYTDADYVLYADLPGLSSHQALPDSHRFIGPVLWSPDATLPDWWETLDAQRPIIYVTLGSSGNNRLLPHILEAFEGLDMLALVASAGAGVSDLRPPDNVRVADYLPGSLAAACSALVVCNGGSPTTYQALASGTPVIGIATNLDQFLNMSTLERSGLGILMRSEGFSAEHLRGSIQRVLAEDAWRSRAEQAREQIVKNNPLSLFPRFVGEIL